MYCPLTGKPCGNPKNIHVAEEINGEPSNMHICQDCACSINQLTGGVAVEPPEALPTPLFPPPFTKHTPIPPGYQKVPPGHSQQPVPPVPKLLFGLPVIPIQPGEGPMGVFAQIMGEIDKQSREQEVMLIPCPSCGQTLAGLKATGKLGCQNCYSFFRDQVGPLLRHCHEGNLQHVGKVPGQKAPPAPSPDGEAEMIRNSLEALQRKMDAAVKEEKYEDAGKIRDQMKYLRAKLEG